MAEELAAEAREAVWRHCLAIYPGGTVDLREVAADGFLVPRTVVHLTAIPDPNLISLPAIHPGDVGLGNPFSVVCESVEAVHRVDGSTLLVGCDNNLPNSGRNPTLADDNEFILIHVEGLPADPDQES